MAIFWKHVGLILHPHVTDVKRLIQPSSTGAYRLVLPANIVMNTDLDIGDMNVAFSTLTLQHGYGSVAETR
jgi:hypothetical protein